METQTLQAEVREGSGKGPARQLRKQGRIPAVFYGPGVDTIRVSVSPKELVRALSTDMGRNQVLALSVGGDEHLAMVKDLQVDPVGRHPIHVDFYRVSEDRPVTVKVPLRTRGRAAGVQKGGKMRVVFRELPVKARPGDLPPAITVEVTSLELGQIVKVSDLPLPDGVEVLFSPERRVILVGEDKRAKQAAEEAAAAAAGEAAPTAAG